MAVTQTAPKSLMDLSLAWRILKIKYSPKNLESMFLHLFCPSMALAQHNSNGIQIKGKNVRLCKYVFCLSSIWMYFAICVHSLLCRKSAFGQGQPRSAKQLSGGIYTYPVG